MTMTITIYTFDIINEVLNKIFNPYTENNNNSFSVNSYRDKDTKLMAWGINLSSNGTQSVEAMEDTIKRLTMANNLCKALNELEIKVDWNAETVIDTLRKNGNEEEASELNNAQVDYLKDALERYSDKSVIELVLSTVDNIIRGKTL